MKHEGGPHRVQRVPVTESQGRIHTSSATVTVLPEAEEVDVAHRPQRPADRRLPLVGPGRPVGEHHRLGGAHHPQADRRGGVDAGREEPDPEPGQGHAGAAGAAAEARAGRQQRPSCPTRAGARSAAAGGPRRSAPTTSRRTGSPTTASGSRSTSSTRCWPASSTTSSTRWSPTSAAASCRRRVTVDGAGRRRPSTGAPLAAPRPSDGSPPPALPDARGRRPADRRAGVGCRGEPSYALVLDEPATHAGVAHFDAMVARRPAGEPLQYVLGRWGFRTLDLLVDRRVLIPRPETEEVVGYALAELDRLASGSRRRAPLCSWSTWAPGRARSPCRWPPSGRASRCGPPTSRAEALDVARANLAGSAEPAPGCSLAEGSWFDALPADAARADRPGGQQPALRRRADEPAARGRRLGAAGGPALGTGGHRGLSTSSSRGTRPGWLRPAAWWSSWRPHQAESSRRSARADGLRRRAWSHPDLAGRGRGDRSLGSGVNWNPLSRRPNCGWSE